MSLIPAVAEVGAQTPGPRASLSVKGLTVAYPGGTLALDNATFELGAGTICGLVGINGSGKSTLFKSIMGFLAPAAGSVTVAGMPPRQAQKRNIVAYVPQAEEVDWTFPVLVEDVVMMGRFGHMGILRIPSAEDKRRVDEALARVGLSALRKRQIGELSGGQRKRVFLARAIAQQGLVILLDEPFTGVDVKTESEIIALLETLRDEGHLILVSTHNLGSIPEFCDRVVLLRTKVIAAGPTETTFTPANLKKAFGGVLRHFSLEGSDLHDDDDARSVTVLTDDERPAVFYGRKGDRERPRQTRSGEAEPGDANANAAASVPPKDAAP